MNKKILKSTYQHVPDDRGISEKHTFQNAMNMKLVQ